MDTKKCTKCGEEKEFTEYYKRSKGLHAQCKECMRKHARQYEASLPKPKKQERRTKANARRVANREYITRKQREYRMNNNEKVNAARRANYRRNLDQNRENSKRKQQEAVDDLLPRYVVRRIISQSNGMLTPKDIPPELINLKRNELILTRKIKRLKNEK